MIVRELLAVLGFELDEGSLIRAENAFEAIAKKAFTLQLSLERIGNIGSTAMQEMEYAAKQNGLSADELTRRFGYLSRAVSEAAHTGGAAGAAFQRLGFQQEDLIDGKGHLRDLPTIMMKISKALVEAKDPTQAQADATAVLGRNSATILPFLKQGPEGIRKWGEELRKTGGYLTPQMVEQGQKLYHTLILVDYTIKGLIYATLGPLISSVNQVLISLAGWTEAHRQIIAARIQGVILGIAQAFQFAAWAVSNFTKSFAILGAGIFAYFFPITAAFASLFLIAEDLYRYFALDDHDSVTYLVIESFKLLGKQFQFIFRDWNLARIFTEGIKAAEEFFTYLENRFRIGSGEKGGSVPGIGGYLTYLFNQIPGIYHLGKSLGVDPDDPNNYIFKHDLFGGGVPFSNDYLSQQTSRLNAGSSQGITIQQLIVNSPTGSPQDVASSVRRELGSFLSDEVAKARPF